MIVPESLCILTPPFAVTIPVTFTPLGNVGALEPPLSVKLSARILPPPPERGVGAPVVPIPKMSETKSSPSAMVISIPDATAISGYCVYATTAVPGTSIERFEPTSKT